MNRGRLQFAAYLTIVISLALLGIEYVSERINRSNGVDLPFLVLTDRSVRSFHGEKHYNSLDPHLGYARADSEPDVEAFRARYQWHRGFAIYNRTPGSFPRPVILTLGGSTTDALQHETSWPEELARLLVENGLEGTVINGGTGGYTSNQGLLKLIRDGIEFHPDLIISYDGVNERSDYSALPNPMVHNYQREILESLTRAGLPPLMPNTIVLLRRLGGLDNNDMQYTLGLETKRNLGEWYARNFTLMEAVARASGAVYLGVIQPNAYVGNYQWAAEYEKGANRSKRYIAEVRSFYSEFAELKVPAHSFIGIFDGIQGVYNKDGIHTSPKGDRIIAENMLSLIRAETDIWKY